MKKIVSLFNPDHKQDIYASASNSAKRINNNNKNDDEDVSNTKQSSSLVHTRNNFNSNSNSNSTNNSNRNNKNVKVINARITEIDQANQKVDNTTCQGIVYKSKKKKVGSLFNPARMQVISASVSNSAKSITNNNNNDDDNVSNTKQSSSLVHTRNNYNINYNSTNNSNSNSNNNSNNKNVKVIDKRTKENVQSRQKVDNNAGQDIVRKPMEKKAVTLLNSDPKQDGFVSVSNPAKAFTHNNNYNDDAVSNMKQSSSLVNNCNNFKSNNNSNSNSNCNNKNVNVLNTRINESDRSNQNVDNITGQGNEGN